MIYLRYGHGGIIVDDALMIMPRASAAAPVF